MEHTETHAGHDAGAKSHPYRTLGLMALVSFVAMYVLMYAMVDRAANILPSLNQAYMAALMAAPMVAIELILMRHMYRDARLNGIFFGASAVVLVAAFFFIRFQVGINDAEFLRSMVPHHSGAILMCEQATLTDPDVRALCQNIIVSQRAEIAEMKALLAER